MSVTVEAYYPYVYLEIFRVYLIDQCMILYYVYNYTCTLACRHQSVVKVSRPVGFSLENINSSNYNPIEIWISERKYFSPTIVKIKLGIKLKISLKIKLKINLKIQLKINLKNKFKMFCIRIGYPYQF